METIGRALKVLVLLTVLILVVAALGAYAVVQRSLPQADGTVHLQGVKARVEIVRDSTGVPHIYAQNQEDLFFAQGYVHAQDRLWQLEFNRRVAAGRLSEVLGRVTLETDTYLRTLGLGRIAQAEAASMDADTRLVLDAYSRGINAFVESHQDSLPLEFIILGFKPEPWTPADTLGWGKVMSLDLGGNMGMEVWRARVVGLLGEAKLSELEAGYPVEGPFIVPELGSTSGADAPALSAAANPGTEVAVEPPLLAALAERQTTLNALLMGVGLTAADGAGLTTEGIGSNNWVVSGSRTQSGKPLLANDPHLGIQLPSIWYQVHLSGGGLDVIGASFPGAPAVIIGHNQRIAWGVTNVGPDVQDLYIEKMNPQNPRQYEYQGQWVDAQVVREQVKVKGEAPVDLKVLVTRHGPIITPVLKGVTQSVALRWTALDPGTLFKAVRLLDQAQNWEEFRAALAFWDVPSQNFVYADVDGNIGYQTPGRIPIRAKGTGMVPVPGQTGEYEWTGFIPFDDLPRVYNPAKGYVVTANNAVVSRSYKYFISSDWAAPYRAIRIETGIKAKEKLTAQDMRDIQADVVSIPAQQLAGYLAKLEPIPERDSRAVKILASWDGKLGIESVGGSIAEVTLVKVMRSTFADELGDLADSYMGTGVPVLLRLLAQPDSPWWDNVTTSPRETRDAILTQSLGLALDDLTTRLGSDMNGWGWGKLHTATFAHPLGSVQPLDRIFNSGPHATPGDAFTPDNNGFNWRTFVQSTVSSYRQIIDLSDLGASVFRHTVGQSGQPFSKHFADYVADWVAVKHGPMFYSRGDIIANAEGTLVLEPM